MATGPATLQIPGHSVRLLRNIFEAGRLLEIHQELTGERPGRRRDVEVLNKTCMVLLVATWEAFVEDLAEASFKFLLRHASDANVIPDAVKAKATKFLTIERDPLVAWRLAGTGWKRVVRGYGDRVLDSRVRGLSFNTPSHKNVDALFHELIGLRRLSRHWTWSGRSAASSRASLAALIKTRGEIAHRVEASTAVRKSAASRAFGLITGISARSSDAVRDHLRSATGKSPWKAAPWGL